MHIRDQALTIRRSGDKAFVTLAFTVVLLDNDMKLGGGYLEAVGLSPEFRPVAITHRQGSLPIDDAVTPSPTASFKELYREHTFQLPRHPAGPFTTVRVHGYIEITPAIKRDDYKITSEVVLPATYTLTSAVRAVSSRIRDLVGR